MKKLMCAAAALIAGVAVADITSANIVGYAGTQLDDDWGFVLAGSQFVNIGGSQVFRLGDVKPVASTDYVVGNGDVEIQTLTSGGGTESAYKWNGSKWVNLAGGADASDVMIPAGKGLWVANSVDPEDAIVTFQTAGEVGTADIVARLDDDWGFVAIANGFPVPFKLGQISLEPTEDYSIGNGDVEIQTLTSGGATEKAYKWTGAKWVNLGTGEDANDVVIPAGKGLWVANSVDPEDTLIDLRIPAPEL